MTQCLSCCRFYKPPIMRLFKLKCVLSVNAKARLVWQNLWTLLPLSAQNWIHLPVSLFVQGESYSNSPSYVYHRLALFPSPISSPCRNKQIPWHWFQRQPTFRHWKGWKRGRKESEGREEAKRVQRKWHVTCLSGNRILNFVTYSKPRKKILHIIDTHGCK